MRKFLSIWPRYAIPAALILMLLSLMLWRVQAVERRVQALQVAQDAQGTRILAVARNASPALPNSTDVPQRVPTTSLPSTATATRTLRPAASATGPAPSIQPSSTATPTLQPTPSATASPKPTATPTRSPTPRPTATPTFTPALLVPLADSTALARYVNPTPSLTPTPTAIPDILLGKILFQSLLFVPSGQRRYARLYAVDPDGGNLSLLLDPWPYRLSLEREWFSPDGLYRACQIWADHGLDLHLCPLAGGAARQVTFVGHGKAYDPAWAPDSMRLAFASSQEGDDDIFVVDIKEPRTIKLTQDDTWQSDKHPSFSPDGRQIVFYSNRTGQDQIWIMNADGSAPRVLVGIGADCWDPVWVKTR